MIEISMFDLLPVQNCDDVSLAATVDKLHEAFYFYHEMLKHYHNPSVFRYNLNAFIQALRNVTWMLQAEPCKPDGFAEWYAVAQSRMKADSNLKKFQDLRNLIVKQGMLIGKSRAYTGIYHRRNLKLGTRHDVDPFAESDDILSVAVGVWTSAQGFLDKEHSAIGDQVGVERIWIVEELGERDVTEYCRLAFAHVHCIIQQVVAIAGGCLGAHDLPDSNDTRILLETDVDPTLVHEWGWE